MAQNNPTPPASDEPFYETEISSIEVLWHKHRGALIAAVVVVLVLIFGGIGWIAYNATTKAAATAAFADAKSEEALADLIAKYPTNIVSGNASLLLAEIQRDAEKVDEANATLNAFLTRQPNHPFAPLAKLALAQNAAVAGEGESALEQLQAIADGYAGSFVAPVALMVKGELALALDKRNDSLRAFEMLSRIYPDSVAAQSTAPVYTALIAMAETRTPQAETPETPESIPASEPAADVEAEPTPAETAEPSPTPAQE